MIGSSGKLQRDKASMAPRGKLAPTWPACVARSTSRAQRPTVAQLVDGQPRRPPSRRVFAKHGQHKGARWRRRTRAASGSAMAACGTELVQVQPHSSFPVTIAGTPCSPAARAPNLCQSCAQNEADAYRNIKLRVEDVQGRNCLTQFHVSAGGGGRCRHAAASSEQRLHGRCSASGTAAHTWRRLQFRARPHLAHLAVLTLSACLWFLCARAWT